MQWTEVIDYLLMLRSSTKQPGYSGPKLDIIDSALRLAKYLSDDETPPPDDVSSEKGGYIMFEWLKDRGEEYIRIIEEGYCVYCKISYRGNKYKVIIFRLLDPTEEKEIKNVEDQN